MCRRCSHCFNIKDKFTHTVLSVQNDTQAKKINTFTENFSEISQLELSPGLLSYESLTSVKDAAMWVSSCLFCSSLSEDWATWRLIF